MGENKDGGAPRSVKVLTEIGPGLILVKKSGAGPYDPQRPKPVKTAQRRAQLGRKALVYRGENPVRLFVDRGIDSQERTDAEKKNYQSRVRTLLALISGKDEISDKETWDYPWHQISATQIIALRNLLAKNIAENINKASYCNTIISALKSILHLCYKAELLSYERLHRLLQIKGFRVPKGVRAKRRGIVSEKTMCKALRNLPLGSPNTARDHLLIMIGYKLGLRGCEITALDVDDYDREKRVLHIKGKGGSYRYCKLDKESCDSIDAWLAFRTRRPGPLLTQLRKGGALDFDKQIVYERLCPHSISTIMRRLRKQTGIKEHFTAYDLRRTCITSWFLAGNDSVMVARMAGHTSPATTAHYDCRTDEHFDRASLKNHRRCNRALKRAQKAALAKNKEKPKKPPKE